MLILADVQRAACALSYPVARMRSLGLTEKSLIGAIECSWVHDALVTEIRAAAGGILERKCLRGNDVKRADHPRPQNATALKVKRVERGPLARRDSALAVNKGRGKDVRKAGEVSVQDLQAHSTADNSGTSESTLNYDRPRGGEKHCNRILLATFHIKLDYTVLKESPPIQ